MELPQPGFFGDHAHIVVGKADDHGVDQDQPGSGQGSVGLAVMGLSSFGLFPSIKPVTLPNCAPESDINEGGDDGLAG
jgi:hypothetical protein